VPARAVLAVAPVDVSANSRTGGAQTSPRKLIMMRHARNVPLLAALLAALAGASVPKSLRGVRQAR
jgi:hypothetical protein